MKNLLLALLPIVLSFSGSSAPKVAKCPLKDLTRFADAIFVGRVEEVLMVVQPDHRSEYDSADPLPYCSLIPIAKVSVQRPLKGVKRGEVAHYLAMSTWICDTTTADTGETALFFLERSDWADQLTATFRSNLKRRTGEPTTHLLGHVGRGRMPLRIVDGEEYVTFRTDIVLPEDLATIDGPGPKKRSFIRSIRLESLVERLQQIFPTQRPYLCAANRTPLSPDRGWQLEVWGDGFAFLDVDDPDRPVFSEITIGPATLEALKRKLGVVTRAGLPLLLGQAGPDGPRRRLEIDVGDEPARTLEIHTLFPDLLGEESERRQAVAVLELWCELRSLFDTERTLDFRPYDRSCLEAWR